MNIHTDIKSGGRGEDGPATTLVMKTCWTASFGTMTDTLGSPGAVTIQTPTA